MDVAGAFVAEDLGSFGETVLGALVSALGGCDLGFFSFDIFSFCEPFETSFFFFSTPLPLPPLPPFAVFGDLLSDFGALGFGTDSVSPFAGDLVSSRSDGAGVDSATGVAVTGASVNSVCTGAAVEGARVVVVKVGAVVGAEGARVVAVEVGAVVGADVAAVVEATVGMEVAAVVVAAVGADVAAVVGAEVGVDVAAVVGDTVGANVSSGPPGAEVGAPGSESPANGHRSNGGAVAEV